MRAEGAAKLLRNLGKPILPALYAELHPDDAVDHAADVRRVLAAGGAIRRPARVSVSSTTRFNSTAPPISTR